MSERELSGVGADFVEATDATFDADNHYKLLETASGRTAIPADSDQHWVSDRHYVGRFWVVRPRNGQPELVSYRLPFSEAEVIDDEFLGLPNAMSFERCWAQLLEGEQHLTPHQRSCVEGTQNSDWSRGHVVYAPRERTWLLRVAVDLIDDEPTLLAVRQRFAIEPTCCRVVGDEHFN